MIGDGLRLNQCHKNKKLLVILSAQCEESPDSVRGSFGSLNLASG